MIEFQKKEYHNSNYKLHTDILSKIQLHPNPINAQRETSFIKDICKRVQTSSTIIYILKDDDMVLGFIGLSVSSISEFPSLQVDYLHVSSQYRGKRLEILDDMKTSAYLIDFAINIAKQIQNIAGLRYLVLLPDNTQLEKVYKDMGFQKLEKDWMFLKLR